MAKKKQSSNIDATKNQVQESTVPVKEIAEPEAAKKEPDFGFVSPGVAPLNISSTGGSITFQSNLPTTYLDGTPVAQSILDKAESSARSTNAAGTAKADPYFKRLIDELEAQFIERMEKLGLGCSFNDSEATAAEKAKSYAQRDEFIGRELFRKYGYEEFITFCDGLAISDYWTSRMEFMRPCNAYNGQCRFDCPYLENDSLCPQKGGLV